VVKDHEQKPLFNPGCVFFLLLILGVVWLFWGIPIYSLVRALFEGETICWDICEPCRPFGYEIAWSPDGRKLAVSGDLGIYVFTDELQEMAHNNDRGSIVSWYPTSDQVIVNTSYAFDVQTLTQHPLMLPEGVVFPAWSPDWDMLAGMVSDDAGYHYSLTIWSVVVEKNGTVSFQQPEVLESQIRELRSLVWSPDGQKLAGLLGNTTVRVWDTVTGESYQFQQPSPMKTPWDAWPIWQPDNKRLAVVVNSTRYGEADTILVWDVESGEIVNTRESQQNLLSVVPNPDGTRWAVNGELAELQIWDAVTGAYLDTLNPYNSSVHAIAWSPDGTKIAATGLENGKNVIWVFDVITGDIISTTTYTGDEIC
jgi:WD40 repeat protein